MSHRILHVEWNDSVSTGRWRGRKQARSFSLTKCQSVGIVIRDDDEVLVLAQSWSDEGDEVNDTIAIPQKCVTRRHRLGTVRVKR